MSTPWDSIISAEDLARYDAAGFGRAGGLGTRAALLIIDVQYRTLGEGPKPFMEAIKDYPTAVGEDAWNALDNITTLLDYFRANDLPVLYPHVAPKKNTDGGRLAGKVPAIMNVADRGYEIPEVIAPRPQDVMLPKKHPSAFFGTPLVSHLIDLDVDTVVVTGCSTSGCVRSTVVDAFAYNFHVAVPHDAVYDRSQTVHLVNLFDMAQKYADVGSSAEIIAALSGAQLSTTGEN
jgi:nicotinamidase-related amidase